MSAKKSFRLRYDAAVTLTFCLVSFLVLILDEFVFKNRNLVQEFFTLPGAKGAAVVFDFKNPMHYVKLIFYIFGNQDFLQFLTSFAFILPLGTLMEERYGSPAVLVMMLITALLAGVLNACIIPATMCGAWAVALMLILLSSITSLGKNELPISAILILALCIGTEFYLFGGKIDKNKIISVLTCFAGALCGSMFGFFTAPKSRRTAGAKPAAAESSKESKGGKQKKPSLFERAKKARKEETELDVTVVGDIDF